MPESLLSPSGILLYGRLVKDLNVTHDKSPSKKESTKEESTKEEEIHRPFVTGRGGASRFLDRQLEQPDAQLARIYGFSFEGYYYDMVRPVIFLVHGPGVTVEEAKKKPFPTDLTAVGAQDYSFPDDMMAWSYDKGDFSIRLDVESGTFEEILLEAELVAEDMQAHYSGQKVRHSGQKVRSSGQKVRYSGQKVRGGGLGD